jgi:hypothetical protein
MELANVLCRYVEMSQAVTFGAMLWATSTSPLKDQSMAQFICNIGPLSTPTFMRAHNALGF